MKNWSPLITPPSPICVVMPGTLRSACSSEVTPCSASVSPEITLTTCGASCGSGMVAIEDPTRRPST